jgi:hypothetical protein
MHEDIIWFYISMDQFIIVKDLIPSTELFYQLPNLYLRNIRILFHELLERTLIAVLHNEIKVVLTCYLQFSSVD